MTGVASAWLYGQESTRLAGNRTRAGLLAEEGLEAVRNIRDASFPDLNDGTYGLGIDNNQWVLVASPDVDGLFSREITITSLNANRKQVTSQVTWQQNLQRSGEVSVQTILTNWRDDDTEEEPIDCTGPPQNRPTECNDDDGGGGQLDCTGPPQNRPPECE